MSFSCHCSVNINNHWRLAISEEDSFHRGFVSRKDYGAKKFFKDFKNKNLASVVCEEVADEE